MREARSVGGRSIFLLAFLAIPSAAGLLPATDALDPDLPCQAEKKNPVSYVAITRKAGHCSDYHGLCSALTRALGYPARVTYGLNTFPKNSPSHCKAEVFLPEYGWVSFDLSETQRLCEKVTAALNLDAGQKARIVAAARRRLLAGFRDNTWLLLTRGTDYDLAPPARRKVAVVRTVYAEADGEALPDPDPGDGTKREFAWMTLHSFTADREVSYPFGDLQALAAEAQSTP